MHVASPILLGLECRLEGLELARQVADSSLQTDLRFCMIFGSMRNFICEGEDPEYSANGND
jgi:hypothetical protein